MDRIGQLVPIIRKTWFDFNCAVNTTSEIILADKIDLAAMHAGQLIARLYSVGTFASPTAVFRLSMRNMSIAPDEPQTDFVESNDFVSVDFTSADAAPKMKYQAYGGAGATARMLVSLIQGNTAGRVRIAIGVDLLMRWI